MSYQNKLEEINEKLARLQQSGGVSRPLVPMNSSFEQGGGRFEEVLTLLDELKKPLSSIGAPASKENLIRGIEKKSGADKINALFDFFSRFRGGLSEEDAARFNLVVADVFKEKYTPAELLRLSERVGLPVKKRQRMTHLVEVLRSSISSVKKLPEVIVIKNELEGYLNEKQNERDVQKLLKNTKSADFEEDFEGFCALELGDILEPPVALPSAEVPATVFGYLESVLEELFLTRCEIAELKSEFSGLSRGCVSPSIKNTVAVADTTSASTPPVALDTSYSDETFGNILDELSALKEDIKSALNIDEKK